MTGQSDTQGSAAGAAGAAVRAPPARVGLGELGPRANT